MRIDAGQPRGPKGQHGAAPGERRGGRPKGGTNKGTKEVRALAQQYGPAAIRELAHLAGLTPKKQGCAVSEQARIYALNTILDRAYGKSTQPMEHSVDEGLEAILDRLGRLP